MSDNVSSWGPILFALLAGASLPLQAGLNTQLGRHLGHPLHAALVSFVIGAGSLAIYNTVTRVPWPHLASGPTPSWTIWLGGLLGAFYVASMIILAPKLGAAGMISLTLAGQMFASIAMDHFGVVGYAPHPVSGARLLGAVLIVGGVVLVQRV